MGAKNMNIKFTTKGNQLQLKTKEEERSMTALASIGTLLLRRQPTTVSVF